MAVDCVMALLVVVKNVQVQRYFLMNSATGLYPQMRRGFAFQLSADRFATHFASNLDIIRSAVRENPLAINFARMPNNIAHKATGAAVLSAA